ncbi:MAG: EpsG family protein [Clostridium sp.]|nr:EpsG family protein [Clostridium sp.]
MWLYLIIFIIPIIAYHNGGAENRNRLFLATYMGALAIFVGFSDMFGGYDRYIYSEIFDVLADGITYNNNYAIINSMSFYEIGYSALCYAIALITENRYIYIFIITVIMYYCFYKSFEENMTNYPLALIIFLGMVFFFTFTYLRQVLAFSVAWMGVRYLIGGKKWKFILTVIIVASLHKSGIIFFILYFLPLKKYKTQTIILILAFCGILGLSGITGALYDAYTAVADSDSPSTNNYSSDGGARIAYLFEVIFFVWIIIKNYNHIYPTRRNLIFLNMAWAFCAMLLLFIRSSDGGRVAWFFTLGIIYIITLICTSNGFKHRVKNSIGSFIVVVMLFLYVRVYVSWQSYNMLYPYKTFLTNGYRDPDYIRRLYEYDHNYDNDKFYRPAFRFLR